MCDLPFDFPQSPFILGFGSVATRGVGGKNLRLAASQESDQKRYHKSYTVLLPGGKLRMLAGVNQPPPSEKMWAVVSSDKTVDRPATRGGQPCNSPPTPPEMFKNVVKTPISFFFVRYKSQSFCQGQPPKI